MTYTLWQATLDICRVLDHVWESTSTGGSTSTLEDSAQEYPDGFFAGAFGGGPLWLAAYSNGTDQAASLQDTTTHSGNVLTFSPVHAQAVPAGVWYAAARPIFTRRALVQGINAALLSIGQVLQTVEMAATGAASYDSDDDASLANVVRRVEVARTDGTWQKHDNWEQVIDDGARVLIFDGGYIPAAGETLRMHSLVHHAALSAAADVIDDDIDRNLLVWSAAVHCLRARWQLVGNDSPHVQGQLEAAQQQEAIYRNRARGQRLAGRVRSARY